MPVTYNTSTTNSGTALNDGPSWSHTVSSNEDRILLVGISIAIFMPTITHISYDGDNLTKLDEGAIFNAYIFYYLLAPSAGAGTLSISGSSGEYSVIAADFYNVDQDDPFYNTYEDLDTNTDENWLTATCDSTDQLVVSFGCAWDDAGLGRGMWAMTSLTPNDPTTIARANAPKDGPSGMSYVAGIDGTREIGWEYAAAWYNSLFVAVLNFKEVTAGIDGYETLWGATVSLMDNSATANIFGATASSFTTVFGAPIEVEGIS